MGFNSEFKGLNTELNHICHLLALLGAHHILHVSRISVKLSEPSNANTHRSEEEKQRFKSIKRSGHYMYHQFNIQQFYVLPTPCIYVFCVDLRTNCDYFPVQH